MTLAVPVWSILAVGWFMSVCLNCSSWVIAVVLSWLAAMFVVVAFLSGSKSEEGES